MIFCFWTDDGVDDDFSQTKLYPIAFQKCKRLFKTWAKSALSVEKKILIWVKHFFLFLL